MNILFVIDTLEKAGGGNSAVKAECDIISGIFDEKIKISFLTTSRKNKDYLEKKFDNKVLFFEKNSILNKFFLFLIQSTLFKFFLKRKKINNPFEKLLSKNKIDLVVYLTPTDLVLFPSNVNYIYTVWEFQHKNYPFFPEYKNIYFDIDIRDQILKTVSEKAYKVIVGTEKSKKEFSKYYLCDENKIIIRPLKPSIININLRTDFNTNLIERLKEKKIKKYLLYPAQYWAHKNHKYIIDAFICLSKKNKQNISCIFVGSNKGNFEYINNLLIENKLVNNIHTFGFLTDNEIVYLYKNCYAVIVPTLVGSISYPVIEGFYYQKPVICNFRNIDNNYRDYIFPLDIKNSKSLDQTLTYMKENKNEVSLKTKEAKFFFNEKYNSEKLSSQFIEIFNEFNHYKNMWKK